jgi:hypothetical protein
MKDWTEKQIVIGFTIIVALFIVAILVGQVNGLEVKQSFFQYNIGEYWNIGREGNEFNSDNQIYRRSFEKVFLSLGDGHAYTGESPSELIQEMKNALNIQTGTGNLVSQEFFEDGYDWVNNMTAPYVIYKQHNCVYPTIQEDCTDYVKVLQIVKVNGKNVLIQYIAEQDLFKKYMGEVKQVINSIKPLDNSNSTQKGKLWQEEPKFNLTNKGY